ncbi:unnamed protein product [Adineta steineri]|uniref:Protein YIPF n=1 Tax=Adineta steineri TaxID=433720 RepID=A0A818WDX8_9BILA|nr:unnamed protein product [Adineta steineri]CAF3705853.1 unnamed protein product [Adineta steineri]CAF3724740.1 unnamed protein product [Adineta steineri]
MSWNPEGFFDPNSLNQQYTGPTSFELQQQQQQQQQQQHYAPPPQQHAPYAGGHFMPAQYNINSQGQPNQYYRPDEYLPQQTHVTGNGDDEELPLLEELGINFDHIFKKTKSVLNPFSTPDTSILDDVDLAGPLVFCLAFASSLLLLGKIHFGYVYGIVTLGTVGMYGLLNMMTSPDKPCSGLFVTSVLGYCLLPMVILSFSSFLFKFNGLIGLIIAMIFIVWCSLSASKLFATSLAMIGQQILVAYPCALFYGVFALLTIF